VALTQSPYGFISDAYGKNHYEIDRPFKQLLRGYDGSQLSEVGDFAGKELYEVSGYVDKVARPKLVFWSSSGERVERVWLEPAERAVLERLVKHFKVNEKPYTSGDWFHYFCCVYLIGDPGISCILTVTNQTAYAIYKYGDESTKKFLPFFNRRKRHTCVWRHLVHGNSRRKRPWSKPRRSSSGWHTLEAKRHKVLL
jgi:acyl-CoA dehydrogenase